MKRLAVTKWETGGHAPTSENLVELARVLGVTSEYLVYGEGGAYRKAVTEIAAIAQRALATPPPSDEEGEALRRRTQERPRAPEVPEPMVHPEEDEGRKPA